MSVTLKTPIATNTHFYNPDKLVAIFLTCDLDWAPEFCIEKVLFAIEHYQLKITIFATHHSPLLTNPPNFVEVGLHPDFTRPNTDFATKMHNLKSLYPRALGMRSHRNFFGQNISDLAKQYNLHYDVSSFLWNLPHCGTYHDYNDLLRISYMWEDGIHLDMECGMTWDKINLHSPGLKILNVHPILMYLNSSSDNHRRSVTSQYQDLTQAPKSEIDTYIQPGVGIFTFWETLLEFIAHNNIDTYFISELLN